VVSGNPAKAPARLGLAGLAGSTPRAYAEGYRLEMQERADVRARDCDAALAFQLPASLYLRTLRIPTLLEEVEVTAMTQRVDRSSGLRRARHWLTARKLTGFVRRLASELDHLTVVSEPERQALIDMRCHPDRVSVVPNGADPCDLQRHPAVADALTLVYPGALTYSANLDAVRWFLAEVWPIVIARCPQAKFIVTGSTGDVDLATLPPHQGVEFIGFVDDVKRVIERSRACVVPLRVGGGTRLKVLEALALGTPVIATSKAVEGLEVTADSNVLIADTAETFAAQVLRLFADPQLADRLRTSGRALVESRYTWPRMAALLNERIQQIVS
jgi:glycosyltransferase involved in cell wall biosynthesis